MYKVYLLVLNRGLLAGYMYVQDEGSMSDRQKGYCFYFAAGGSEKCIY